MSRRLSKGNLLNLFDDDNDDLEEENEIDTMAEINSKFSSKKSGRSSTSKRRASLFGTLKNTSPSKILAEQSRIADMYKAVIKLSSENKINEKNSWNFDLIDHMGSIIKDESQGQRGVNFQKVDIHISLEL